MKTNWCKKCKIEKDISNFYFRKDSNSYRNECKECFNLKIKSRRIDNPNYLKNYLKGYRQKNKDKAKEYGVIWRKENSEYLKSYFKNRRENNSEYFRENYKNRMLTDDIFRLKEYIRKIIINSFRFKSLKKSRRTHEIIGCTYEFLKLYIEHQFEDWMNWNNYGKFNGSLNYGWDIDHIIPLSTAKTIDDVIKLNHYTNLQPLCSYHNRYIKRDNILLLPL
jgi:hypothetical protein